MASNKAMLFPFIAFRPKVANYSLVYYKDDLFTVILIKIINWEDVEFLYFGLS